MRTFGLIPAAGQSRRMGRPKLLLPVGETTVLELVVAAARAGGVAHLLVVVAPQAEELAQRAAKAGAEVLQLPQDTPDMRTTCLHGLAWMQQHWQPLEEDGWLLLPADHPTIQSKVVHAILGAAQVYPDKTIIVPAYQQQRGHPTWLRWQHVGALRSLPPEQGLNTFIRQRAAETLELAWTSNDILRDLDTPADYQRLLADQAK